MKRGAKCLATVFFLAALAVGSRTQESTAVEAEDNTGPGPDTCGQDRDVLASWFLTHGMPYLMLDPLPPLFDNVTENPYDNPLNPPSPDPPESPDAVCAMQWDPGMTIIDGLRAYRLANFSSEAAAVAAQYDVTHAGHCGSCSSLQDLGAYMRRNLTKPTRVCGAIGFVSEEAEMACLMALGFSIECASIWKWNVENTRSKCLEVCLLAWIHDDPNNNPDGSLNDCLQCDEDKSGPNFKYFAGRTRRNSGIPSSIQRPPEEIYNMTHCYWYGDLES